jgi:hypothetical protein
MTLDEAEEILAFWDEQPPACLSLARIEAMLAAYLGVNPRIKSGGRVPRARSAGPGLRRDDPPYAVPGIGLGGDVHAGLGGAAILDLASLKARKPAFPACAGTAAHGVQATGE